MALILSTNQECYGKGTIVWNEKKKYEKLQKYGQFWKPQIFSRERELYNKEN